MPGLWFSSGIDKGFENDLRRMNQKVNQFSSNVNTQSSRMGNAFNKVGTSLLAYFGAQQVLQLGKSIVDTTAKFEKFGIVLENTLGSKVEADNALKMVSDFAANTPFSLDELSDSFIRLTNQGLQPTRDEMVKLGDLASSTGKGFIQLSEAIIDAQTGEFERLKEFGIKARKEGDKVKFTFKGQTKEIDNTAQSIKDYIISLGEMKGVAGANEKIAKSLSGQISNLGDAWTQLLNNIGQSNKGLISGVLKTIINEVNNLGTAIKDTGDAQKGITGRTKGWLDVLSRVNPVLYFIQKAVKNLENGLLSLIPGFDKAIKKTRELLGYTAPSVDGINTGKETREEKVKRLALEKLKKIYEERKKLAEQQAIKAKELSDKEKEALQKAYEKQLKDFDGYLKDQKDAYENYVSDLEGLTGAREKAVKDEYSYLTNQGETYLQFLQNLLAEEKDAKKQVAIKKEISNTLFDQAIEEQKLAEENFQKNQLALQDLLLSYQTYVDKKTKIEEKYNKDILQLTQLGYTAQAAEAEKGLKLELQKLDESILQADDEFQKWLKVSLPSIAKEGIGALQAELDKVSLALEQEGLDPEQVVIYKEKIKEINEALLEKQSIEKESPEAWKDTLEIMNGINELVRDMVNSFDGLDESTKRILTGVTEMAGGVINLVGAFKAVGAAVTSLEKASAVLSLIGAAMKIITAITGIFKKASEERKQAHLNELARIQAVNMELIRQNALYKEGNEYYSTDKWGTVLKGLKTYNMALAYQQTLLDELSVDKPGFIGKFSKSILDRYTDLVDTNGNFNTSLAESIIQTETLSDIDKKRLEYLIEVTNQAEAAYVKFGEYISSIFGGVADEVTKAFQAMYEGGDDAITSLEQSFSDMIESFTRDAIEFAFLQPYLNELNKTTATLGEKYAKGQITAGKLQADIVDSLSGFYTDLSDLQPYILQAFKDADMLAEKAGFSSAFNAPAEAAPVETVVEDIDQALSRAGQIQQAITEETGSELVGRMAALMLSNERIANYSLDMLDYAVQNLVYMKQIALNTEYLPEIAINTRKTVEKLESI